MSEATGRPAHRISTGTMRPSGRRILPVSAVRPPWMRPDLALFELQSGRIDAIPLSGRLGPVRKNMAEVAAAARAEHLGADHPVASVALLLDRIPAGWGVEGRPAAAGIVLRVRLEQGGATPGAVVRARLEDVVVLTAEGRLSALLTKDPVFLRCQLVAPLGVGLLDSTHGSNSTNRA